MVVITTHHVFGLASLLPMAVAAVLVLMVGAARRMRHRSGSAAALPVPPRWPGAMVADGRAAPMTGCGQRPTWSSTPVNRLPSTYG